MAQLIHSLVWRTSDIGSILRAIFLAGYRVGSTDYQDGFRAALQAVSVALNAGMVPDTYAMRAALDALPHAEGQECPT